MKFIEYVDADVPEHFVSGVAQVSLLGPGTVRVLYYSTRHRSDGTQENVPVVQLVLDLQTWLRAAAQMTEARQHLQAAALVAERESEAPAAKVPHDLH